MGETQLERHKRLLRLKGVSEEEEPEPINQLVRSQKLLDLHQQRLGQANQDEAELNALRKRAYELLIERLERMK